MLINDESIYLYNLTLKPPSHYISSIVGHFYKQGNSTKNAQQLVLASYTTLQLFEVNEETGKLELQSSQNLLGTINSIEKICISEVDGVVITSDSGNLSILEYDNTSKKFISKIQEPMTKNGWGRNYVGENLAIDPENRCILVAAMEKNKLLYKIESTSLGSKELSSPLEAHSKQVSCLKIVALNTDHNNPLFGALELTPEKNFIINYYELDQGLNHVVKKKPASLNLDPLPDDVNYMIPLPGHIGGMLVCGSNWCFYDKLDGPRIYLPLPRRDGQTQESIIVNHVTHVLKKKNFFILLQNTLGDLFKLTVDYDFDKETIKNISITYFDTIPPALSLNIFKNGFLFVNVLNNDKLLYQFEKLGDDLAENELVINSSDYDSLDNVRGTDTTTFKLKGLDNLALIDVLETLSPIIDSRINDSKLVTLSSHSYVKSITHGVPTTTLVESPLPITPTDIFTTKLSLESANDEYLVISSSLSSKTLVLSIGEVVEDVEDSEFVLDQSTISVQQVGIASVVQVYSNGIKHIRTVNGKKKTTDWFPPAGITITHASTNNQQVLIALSNLNVVYFEIDSTDDQLIEYQDHLEISTTITAMAIQEHNSEKSSFAIIGCSDETIQVVSLQEDNCLEIKSLQALSANSSSLKMLKLSSKETHVHIGMENGVYARIKIDTINGNLSNSRVKYLGSKPVNLSVIKFSNEIEGVLAISSAPWISYLYRDSFKITPLLEIDITNGSSFISEDIGGEGIVGIKDNNLVIFSVGKEDSVFDPLQDLTISNTKLRYTPRKMITHGDRLFISELEYNVQGPFKCNINGNVKENVDEDYYEAFGYDRKQDSWASCIQVVDDKTNQVIQSLQFEENESIVSMSDVAFNKLLSSVHASHLVVGVCTNQTILPNSYEKSYLYTFKIGKKHLQLVHKTELDYIPQVLENFQDKLLVASNNHIRLYDIGQKQLLKKSTTIIDFSQNINKIIPQSNRIIICDSHKSSIIFAKFDDSQNQFVPFADDIMKRQITSIMNLDIDTLIGGDKFGNIFVTRIDEDISKQADDDWTILKSQEGILNSCPYKLQNLIEFHIGDIITSLNLGCLNLAGTESVIYTGLQGTIGLLVPLVSKSEVELLFNLQLLMQQFQNNLVGKDHLKFRSYYNPIKNVIDGDLLERFLEFDTSLKIEISRKLNKSVNDIEKKLIDLRNRSAF